MAGWHWEVNPWSSCVPRTFSICSRRLGVCVCVDHHDISSRLRGCALHVHSIASAWRTEWTKSQNVNATVIQYITCESHSESVFCLPDVLATTRGGQCQPEGASRGIVDLRLHEASSVPIFRELCSLCKLFISICYSIISIGQPLSTYDL